MQTFQFVHKSPWRRAIEQAQAEAAAAAHAKGHARGMEQGRAEGQAAGEAQSLLWILTAKRLEVSEAQRKRILSCRDLKTLSRWIRRAAVATWTSQVFSTARLR